MQIRSPDYPSRPEYPDFQIFELGQGWRDLQPERNVGGKRSENEGMVAFNRRTGFVTCAPSGWADRRDSGVGE